MIAYVARDPDGNLLSGYDDIVVRTSFEGICEEIREHISSDWEREHGPVKGRYTARHFESMNRFARKQGWKVQKVQMVFVDCGEAKRT